MKTSFHNLITSSLLMVVAVLVSACGGGTVKSLDPNAIANGDIRKTPHPRPDRIGPTVAISSPLTGTTYTSAQMVTVVAAASDDVGIAKVDFYDGSVLKGTDTVAPYTFSWDITAGDNGVHNLTAQAFDAAGNNLTSAPVSVTVNIPLPDTAAPAVAISSPAATTYTSAQTVSVTATASDNVGVTRVEFYDGATLKSSVATSPYTYAWAITSANNGAHSFTAKAFDAAGNSATSTAVTLTVNIPLPDTVPPTVAISSPAPTTYTSAQTVSVTASAADNVGVSRVEFYDGTTLKGNDLTSPFTYGWAITSANNGAHSFTAKAFDAAGNSATSTVVTLTVNIPLPDTAPPTVAISSPAATTYTSAQTVTVTATASDNVGVSRVDFYDGTVLKGSDTSSPFTYAWAITNADNGGHSFTARAFDTAGNNATSSAVTLTVNIPATVGSAILSWGAPTSGGAPTGYKIHWGTASGSYTKPIIDVGNALTYTVGSLTSGTYYFVVTAYNTAGESGFSNQGSKAIP